MGLRRWGWEGGGAVEREEDWAKVGREVWWVVGIGWGEEKGRLVVGVVVEMGEGARDSISEIVRVCQPFWTLTMA